LPVLPSSLLPSSGDLGRSADNSTVRERVESSIAESGLRQIGVGSKEKGVRWSS
jgi:hypothetical protein